MLNRASAGLSSPSKALAPGSLSYSGPAAKNIVLFCWKKTRIEPGGLSPSSLPPCFLDLFLRTIFEGLSPSLFSPETLGSPEGPLAALSWVKRVGKLSPRPETGHRPLRCS